MLRALPFSKTRVPALSLAIGVALLFSGCFRAKSASGELDLSQVPESVAVLLPIPSDSIDFGARPIGSSTDLELTLVNAGPWPATEIQEDPAEPALAAPFAFKGGAFPGTGGTCTTTLEPQATCTLVISYSPAGPGPASGALALRYVNGAIHAPLPISFSGTTTAVLTLSDDPTLDFGASPSGTPVDATLTLSNTGITAAQALGESPADPLTAPFGFKGGSYPGTGGSCGTTLAPGASCTLVLTFSPSSPAGGSYSDTLSLVFDDGSGLGIPNSQVTRALSGTGQPVWTATAASPLAGRSFAASVWTGSQLLVWGGGAGAATKFADGARYDPVADSWSPMSAVGAPSARSHATAVWSAGAATERMIVWGGLAAGDVADATGAMYDPVNDDWAPITALGAPSARFGHTAVWDETRGRMMVWGGGAGAVLGAGLGFEYDPALDTWNAINDALADTPAGRFQHTATWAGSKMLVWGGCLAKNAGEACQLGGETATGAIFDPGVPSWTPISAVGAPSARYQHSAAWNGSTLVIWGGATDTDGTEPGITSVATGGIYQLPPSDSWVATSAVSAPAPRRHALALSVPAGIFIWGGLTSSGTGAILSPANSWAPLSTIGAPTASFGAIGAYAGSGDKRVIVFGGEGAGPAFSGSAAIYWAE
ncbi:MAG: choice-of-anchor D domain-containing protein [Oligoflexia bacterium]|nr:choice-of-anchor D domain-containing protein [Oligoflexia bacterium]